MRLSHNRIMALRHAVDWLANWKELEEKCFEVLRYYRDKARPGDNMF